MITHLITGMSLKNTCTVLHNLQSTLMYSVSFTPRKLYMVSRGCIHIMDEENEFRKDKITEICASKHSRAGIGILLF